MSIIRNARYNLLGALIPLVIAFGTVPLYLDRIGAERYGVLAIFWLLFGYFGIFDIGLGRAVTYRLAASKGGVQRDIDLIWSASVLSALAGIAGTVVAFVLSKHFLLDYLSVGDSIGREAFDSTLWIALAIPVATVASVINGAMLGREEFGLANGLQILTGAILQIVPLVVAIAVSVDLSTLILSCLLSRVVLLLLSIGCLSVRLIPGFRLRPKIRFELLRGLANYGGWVALTSLIGPVLVISDRLVIGATLGAAAIAAYTIPFQLGQRVSILPTAIVGAIFPRLSSLAPADRNELASRCLRAIIALMTPLIVIGLLVFGAFLRVWLGGRLQSDSIIVGLLILVAFWFNGLALVSYNLLQSRGRPDLVAKCLLLELPIYLGILYFLSGRFGLVGCAVAVLFRYCLDYIVLGLVADGLIRDGKAVAIGFFPIGGALLVALSIGMNSVAYWAMASICIVGAIAISFRMFPKELQQTLLRRMVPT